MVQPRTGVPARAWLWRSIDVIRAADLRADRCFQGLQPNIDAALAALVAHCRLPLDAAFGLFATARSVGLLAHSIEQLKVTQVIRPRGRYIGRLPNVA